MMLSERKASSAICFVMSQGSAGLSSRHRYKYSVSSNQGQCLGTSQFKKDADLHKPGLYVTETV